MSEKKKQMIFNETKGKLINKQVFIRMPGSSYIPINKDKKSASIILFKSLDDGSTRIDKANVTVNKNIGNIFNGTLKANNKVPSNRNGISPYKSEFASTKSNINMKSMHNRFYSYTKETPERQTENKLKGFNDGSSQSPLPKNSKELHVRSYSKNIGPRTINFVLPKLNEPTKIIKDLNQTTSRKENNNMDNGNNPSNTSNYISPIKTKTKLLNGTKTDRNNSHSPNNHFKTPQGVLESRRLTTVDKIHVRIKSNDLPQKLFKSHLSNNSTNYNNNPNVSINNNPPHDNPSPSSNMIIDHYSTEFRRWEGKIIYSQKTQAGKSDNGKYKINQDSYLSTAKVMNYDDFNIFAVFDGHGINGHYASSTVGNYLKNYFSSASNYKNKTSLDQLYNKLKENKYEMIHKSFNSAEDILTKSKFDVNFSGCTGVMVIHIGNKLICANAGDSRAILVNQVCDSNKESKLLLIKF